MKKYIVAFSGLDMEEECRFFSTREKAKEFIIDQFKKFIDDGGEDRRELWGDTIESYEEDFEQYKGIEDFAYINEVEEDDTTDVDWG